MPGALGVARTAKRICPGRNPSPSHAAVTSPSRAAAASICATSLGVYLTATRQVLLPSPGARLLLSALLFVMPMMTVPTDGGFKLSTSAQY